MKCAMASFPFIQTGQTLNLPVRLEFIRAHLLEEAAYGNDAAKEESVTKAQKVIFVVLVEQTALQLGKDFFFFFFCHF